MFGECASELIPHVTVELFYPPVHQRIGGKPRFQRADTPRKVAETLLYGVETRKGSEHGKMRRPDVGGNEHRLRTDVEGDREQIL